MNKKTALTLLVVLNAIILGAVPLINGTWDFVELSDGGTPPSGAVRVWANTSGRLVSTDDAGADTVLGAGGGFLTLIDSQVNQATTCDGSAGWEDLLTATAASGTFAVGDVFKVEALASGTTPTTDTDYQILVGGSVMELRAAVDAGIAWQIMCFVDSLTSVRCLDQTLGYSANASQISTLSHTVSDVSANSLSVVVQERSCASDSTVDGHFIYMLQAGI